MRPAGCQLGVIALPSPALCAPCALPPPQLTLPCPASPLTGSTHPAGAGKSPLALLAADCRQLAASPVCILTILALSVYNATLGVYAFYGACVGCMWSG